MAVIEGVSNDAVLTQLFKHIAPDERAVMCTVAGDPATITDPTVWRGHPWRYGTPCPLKTDRNNYVAISSFRADPEDGKYRRTKAQFAAAHAIMIDDIGTKVPLQAVPHDLVPSLVVETSPGNFQATFFLEQPHRDREVVEGAIKQIIEHVTGGGVDPGMAGVTRVLRLPGGMNWKHGRQWQCRVHVWRPEIRTSWTELVHAFNLVERHKVFNEPDDGVSRERKRGFSLVRDGLKALGRVKRNTGSGWFDIQCPWIDEHTGRADTGTAVAPPMKANGYYGGFKCHHGHCESRTWGDLEEWVQRECYIRGRRTAGDFL
jgi:hypothetical protein